MIDFPEKVKTFFEVHRAFIIYALFDVDIGSLVTLTSSAPYFFSAGAGEDVLEAPERRTRPLELPRAGTGCAEDDEEAMGARPRADRTDPQVMARGAPPENTDGGAHDAAAAAAAGARAFVPKTEEDAEARLEGPAIALADEKGAAAGEGVRGPPDDEATPVSTDTGPS